MPAETMPGAGRERSIRVLDAFSCIGLHADGLARVGGFRTVAFCELDPWRRAVIAFRHPGIPIHDDIRTLPAIPADLVFGGPPCQGSSVAAAIHGGRHGAPNLAFALIDLGLDVGAEFIVLEQPPGNAGWEADVSFRLASAGRHVARLEFEARDIGAPYQRRRVFLLSSSNLPRLEIAWREGPRAIERVARAADARGAWNPDQLEALHVDARSSGEHDRGPRSRERRRWIEALGDSNPPGMAEVIGHCILAAMSPATPPQQRAAETGGRV